VVLLSSQVQICSSFYDLKCRCPLIFLSLYA
jgi:hypothetical protein